MWKLELYSEIYMNFSTIVQGEMFTKIFVHLDLQANEFYLYALYNKNKPKSDDLMIEWGAKFFRVSGNSLLVFIQFLFTLSYQRLFRVQVVFLFSLNNFHDINFELYNREKQLSLGDRMDLSSYLLKPVQRMGKYALLLKQILKECPENEQQEYADLSVSSIV